MSPGHAFSGTFFFGRLRSSHSIPMGAPQPRRVFMSFVQRDDDDDVSCVIFLSSGVQQQRLRHAVGSHGAHATAAETERQRDRETERQSASESDSL